MSGNGQGTWVLAFSSARIVDQDRGKQAAVPRFDWSVMNEFTGARWCEFTWVAGVSSHGLVARWCKFAQVGGYVV